MQRPTNGTADIPPCPTNGHQPHTAPTKKGRKFSSNGAPPGSGPGDRTERIVAAIIADPARLDDPETLRFLARLRQEKPHAHAEAIQCLKDDGVSFNARDLNAALARTWKAMEADQKAAARGRASTPRRLGELLPDEPAGELLLPPGYELDAGGVYRITSQDGERVRTQIAESPILVDGILDDASGSRGQLLLRWNYRGDRRQRTISRQDAMNANQLIKLSGAGLPVSTENASALGTYLRKLVALNEERLPTAHIAHQLGWQGRDGSRGFLCGQRLLAPGGDSIIAVDPEELDPATWPKTGLVMFRGADEGDDQLARQFAPRGTLEGWLAAIAPVRPYRRARLALYAGVAPALLEVLGAANFIVEWSSRNSKGKTTCSYLAASTVGNIDLWTWQNTRVWIERAACLANAHPLILDDTKLALKPGDVADVIYMVASGCPKGRGSTEGTQRRETFHTILISTGENPATSFTQDGGTRPRVLSLTGYPFEGDTPDLGRLTEKLQLDLRAHHGHAYPLFVQYLQRHWEERAQWRQAFEQAKERYASTGDSVQRRLADHAAVLSVAAELLHAAVAEAGYAMPWPLEDPMEGLWGLVVSEAGDACGEELALQTVHNEMVLNPSHFQGREKTGANKWGDDAREPHNGWSGVWELGDEWETVGLSLQWLTRTFGENTRPILQAWRERGWLALPKDSSEFVKRVRVPGTGQRSYVVPIRREAFDELARITPGDDDEPMPAPAPGAGPPPPPRRAGGGSLLLLRPAAAAGGDGGGRRR